MFCPRIAIIGAGPGGLALARLLSQNKISCIVFEADHNRSSRDQGGIVDLHSQAGQLALKEAGLLEEFNRNSLPEAEACKIVRGNGEIIWNDDGEAMSAFHAGERPEIDRSVLRDILIDSLAEDVIQWNHKLVSVRSRDGGRHDLQFATSVEEGFDLVVGADGAWSKVRSLLTDTVPHYSGVTIIELQTFNISKTKSWLAGYVGTGSLFMCKYNTSLRRQHANSHTVDDGRSIVCQHNAHADSIRVYAAVRKPVTWVTDCGINWTSPTARQDLIDSFFGDCGADLKRTILEASDSLTPRILHMLPIGLEWESQPGATLIGDAAHLMTPFAGVGVNVALADSLGLARALIKYRDLGQEGMAKAVREYDMDMFVRAKKNMEKTWMGLQHHFSAAGADERVEKLRERDVKIAAHLAAERMMVESSA